MRTRFYDALNKTYGEDHCAIENWDSSVDYPANQYVKVHFRIDCRSYDVGGSWSFSSESAKEKFYDEASSILHSFDIEESSGYCSGREMPKIEHLYIHPQDISGVVEKRKIALIADSINKCETMFCRSVDVYEDISPITNDEFLSIISGKRDEIVKDILSMFATKRKNLYYGECSTDKLLKQIGNKYSIRRRQCESGYDYIAYKFCHDVLRSLVENGLIVAARVKDGTGYRTAKKNELKK